MDYELEGLQQQQKSQKAPILYSSHSIIREHFLKPAQTSITYLVNIAVPVFAFFTSSTPSNLPYCTCITQKWLRPEHAWQAYQTGTNSPPVTPYQMRGKDNHTHTMVSKAQAAETYSWKQREGAFLSQYHYNPGRDRDKISVLTPGPPSSKSLSGGNEGRAYCRAIRFQPQQMG